MRTLFRFARPSVSRELRDDTEVYVHAALFDEEADRTISAIQ